MLDEAKKFWDAISGKIKSLIKAETKNTLRVERYDVTTAPNGTKMGVTEPFGSTELMLPYSEEVRDVKVGDPVLVAWWGSMSNAKVCYHADGFDGATYNQIDIISGTHDLNDYKTPGLYYFKYGVTLSNQPNSATMGWLVVLNGGANGVKQTWRRLTSSSSTGYKDEYIRIWDGSQWSGWTKLAVDVSYKIYNSVTDIGLTSGSATISGVWNALPNYSIAILQWGDIASGQRPTTYGFLEIHKLYSTNGTIDWQSGTNRWTQTLTDGVPNGTWHRTGPVPYIQTGTESTSVSGNSYKEYTVTFSTAFTHTPKVIVCCYTTTTSVNGGALCQAVVSSASSTQFKFRVYNGDSSTRAPNCLWIAVDPSP